MLTAQTYPLWSNHRRLNGRLIDEAPRPVISNVPGLLGARNHVRVDPHPLGWLLVTDIWLGD